jgi:hypothetical protein
MNINNEEDKQKIKELAQINKFNMGMISETQGCMYCEGVCTRECTKEMNNQARKFKLDNLKEIRNNTSLETGIRIGIQMADYDNWDNGDYNGDSDLINRQVDIVLSNIEEWVKNNYINPIRKKNERIY